MIQIKNEEEKKELAFREKVKKSEILARILIHIINSNNIIRYHEIQNIVCNKDPSSVYYSLNLLVNMNVLGKVKSFRTWIFKPIYENNKKVANFYKNEAIECLKKRGYEIEEVVENGTDKRGTHDGNEKGNRRLTQFS